MQYFSTVDSFAEFYVKFYLSDVNSNYVILIWIFAGKFSGCMIVNEQNTKQSKECDCR